MKVCPGCGHQLADDVSCCPECNHPLLSPTPSGSAFPAGPLPLELRPTPPVAILAIIFALIPCTFVIGIILGAFALVQIKRRPQVYRGRGLALAAIGIGMAWIAISVLIVVLPPFIMQKIGQPKGGELERNLNAIYFSEQAYFAHSNTYGRTFTAIDWQPPLEKSNRYSYFLPGEMISNRSGAVILELPAGIKPEVSRTGFTAVAAGNLDADDTLDVWTVNDKKVLKNVIDDMKTQWAVR